MYDSFIFYEIRSHYIFQYYLKLRTDLDVRSFTEFIDTTTFIAILYLNLHI